jgi:hypothetical protein
MTRLRFILGGVFSVVSTRIYKSWDKYDPQSVDEIVKLGLYID